MFRCETPRENPLQSSVDARLELVQDVGLRPKNTLLVYLSMHIVVERSLKEEHYIHPLLIKYSCGFSCFANYLFSRAAEEAAPRIKGTRLVLSLISLLFSVGAGVLIV